MISVLLVEDEPEVLELTRLFLERDTELSVDACLSVKEALQKLNTKIYNVIVSDYYMPDINGIQLLKTLKFQGIDTPLIIFTGKGDETVAIDALNFGAAFYLQKSENPRFQFAKLRKMIYEAALKQRTEEIYRENNICVIIPVHNNEKLIGPILESIPDYIFRVYVIDDASTDKTPEIVRKCTEKDSRITSIRHETHRGTGSSIKSGYREALRESMDIAVVMSGDNQMDPKYLPAFLDPIIKRKADYTVGNRLYAPQYRKNFPKWRFFGNAILTLLTKIASGYWQLMDPQNRYTAISRTALERIDPNTIYSRAGYSNDILVRLNAQGFKAVNVNHPAGYPLEGRSDSRSPIYYFRLVGLLCKDFLWRMKEKYLILNFHPLVFFYFFGALCTLSSLFLGIYALWGKLVNMEPLFVRATLTLILLFIGSLFILFAMLFDMEQERNIGKF
jgi:glycosyltransferase involved in cell wall biosynthesis/ActR/RegA family two-component response regulator